MVKIDVSRDKLFSEQGLDLVNKYYSDGKEGVQRAIARAAEAFSYGDVELAQFIYDAASQHHFFYSSPILSNAPDGEWDPSVDYNDPKFWAPENTELRKRAWLGAKPKALPISCFLGYVEDTISGQISSSSELALLSVAGGGTALHNGIRAVSEKAPGPIPYIKTIDGIMGYYRQGKTRRGSCAVYMDIDHPDILEFIKMRTPSGGDTARKITNRKGVHNAVNITQSFVDAVNTGTLFELRCPHSGEVRDAVPARELWETLLETRELTGEPYIWLKDNANAALPESQRAMGLVNRGSNLCSEISLPTSAERTAVCCLSSVNLERYEEWKDTVLVARLTRFLDNVIQWFIDWSPEELHKTRFSAERERAIGIGAMGWHNFLMSKNIVFEGGGFNSATQWNHVIFSRMREEAVAESQRLAKERGESPDMLGTGRRNSHLFAIAPNANSSILCNTTPSIEPMASNAYTQKTRNGIFQVRNRYLEPVLEKYGTNTPETWKNIEKNNGSVQHLAELTAEEKEVFKTAWEIDQHWLVEHAEARQQYICQSQSLNLFFLPGTDRAYINSVHLKAIRSSTLKSLYYFKTGAKVAADTIKEMQRVKLEDWKEAAETEVCVACEG
jgi:ribonucleoside-diphosphate reductase alpha chain